MRPDPPARSCDADLNRSDGLSTAVCRGTAVRARSPATSGCGPLPLGAEPDPAGDLDLSDARGSRARTLVSCPQGMWTNGPLDVDELWKAGSARESTPPAVRTRSHVLAGHGRLRRAAGSTTRPQGVGERSAAANVVARALDARPEDGGLHSLPASIASSIAARVSPDRARRTIRRRHPCRHPCRPRGRRCRQGSRHRRHCARASSLGARAPRTTAGSPGARAHV